MQRVKEWHAAKLGANPVEKGVWEGVLTLWMMAWMGWLPATAFEAYWAYPVCILGMFAPEIYVKWRASAHEKRRFRCDWLDLVSRFPSQR